MEVPKNEFKTSTQISHVYSPARTVMYDKLPLSKIPELRMDKSYKAGTIYIPQDGLKTTYNEMFKTPAPKTNVEISTANFLKHQRQFSKLGKDCKPLKFNLTEYKEEYPEKQLAPSAPGVSVEKLSTCPMKLTGRDERDPLPFTQGYGKYLDIYVSTSRMAHRAFTLQEQKTIAMKDIVTSQETMDIPKGRGFGCKFPAFAGQDLDNRNKNMFDKILFNTEAKLKYLPKAMPKVPNFGSESETQASYAKPEGYALPHLFDRFTEFPQSIVAPAAKQTLCPPGMYTTESYAINNRTSPQTVV